MTGQPYANAKSALEGQGFVVTRVDVQSDQAQGVVVAEDPPPGTRELEGLDDHALGLEGPGDDAGARRDATRTRPTPTQIAARGAGLTPSVVYQPVTDPSQDGIVIAQDPAPGADAKPGEVVTITVGQLQTRRARRRRRPRRRPTTTHDHRDAGASP